MKPYSYSGFILTRAGVPKYLSALDPQVERIMTGSQLIPACYSNVSILESQYYVM
jgi:hypothetical protein